MTAGFDILARPHSREEAQAWIGTEFGNEGNYYLKQLWDVPPDRLAVVKLGGEIVARDLPHLAGSIAVLSALRLYPVIVHGGGPQINAALEAEGIPENKIDGKRVTDERSLPIVHRALSGVNRAITNALSDLGVDNVGYSERIFTAEVTDERLGYVGDVTDVNIRAIQQTVGEAKVPVLSCFGGDIYGRPLNINGDSAATALAKVLQPHRYLSVTDVRGVLRDDEVIPFLDASNGQIEELIANKVITKGMIPKTREARDLARMLPDGSSVVILSARGILAEFFTNAGSGTMVAPGQKVYFHSSINAASQEVMRTHIDKGYKTQGHQARLVDNYFEKLPKDAEYFDVPRMGFAIVLPGENGDPAYIDKLVVTEEGRGKGVTELLIKNIGKHHKEGIYWRTGRDKDRLHRHYFNFATSIEKSGDWVVFLRDVDPVARQRIIESAVQRERTIAYDTES